MLPSLPSSQRSQVESLQRKLAEGEMSNIQKIQSPPAGIKDIDVKVSLSVY